MLALPRHVKANGEKSLYFRQGLSRDLHFPQILLASQLFSDFDILTDRVLYVRQCLFLGGALRPAPGETRARNAIPLLGLYQGDWVLHASNANTPPPLPTLPNALVC